MITITGDIILSEEYFADVFSSLIEIMSQMQSPFFGIEPTANAIINLTMVFDGESELLTYVTTVMDLEMEMAGHTSRIVDRLSLSRIVYNMEFEPVVPYEIIAAAGM